MSIDADESDWGQTRNTQACSVKDRKGSKRRKEQKTLQTLGRFGGIKQSVDLYKGKYSELEDGRES